MAASFPNFIQVWTQHFEQQEGIIHWRDGPATRNGERVVTPYDPQARESRKREADWLGYKFQIQETCEQKEEEPSPCMGDKT